MKKIKRKTFKKIVWRYVREKCFKKSEELDKFIELVDDLINVPSQKLIEKVKGEMHIIDDFRDKGILSESALDELYVATNIFIQKAIRELTAPDERKTKWEDFYNIANEYNAFEIEGFKDVFDNLSNNLKIKSNKKYDITEEEYNDLKNKIEILEDKLFDVDLYLYYRSKQEFDGALRVFKNRVEKNTKTEVGEKIKKIREEKGYSLIDVSLSTGFSVSYIYRIEQGERNVSLPVALKIAKALRVDVSSFYETNQLDLINEKRILELEEIITLYDYKLNNKKVKKSEKQLLSALLNTLLKIKKDTNKEKIESLNEINSEDLESLKTAFIEFLNK